MKSSIGTIALQFRGAVWGAPSELAILVSFENMFWSCCLGTLERYIRELALVHLVSKITRKGRGGGGLQKEEDEEEEEKGRRRRAFRMSCLDRTTSIAHSSRRKVSGEAPEK